MSEYPMDPGTAPQSDGAPTKTVTAAVLTPIAQQYLDQTQPWVRFMSILAFFGSGLMALVGLAMVAVGMAGGFTSRGGSAAFSAIGGALVGFIYLLLACLYIAPGVFLHRYAGAIKQLKANGTSSALEDALRHQKSFWRFVGILSAVGIVIGVIVLALAVIAGVIGGMIAGCR